MDAAWRLELLGKLRLSIAGEEVALPASRRTGLLLAYVVLQGDRLQPRRELVDRFWPEVEYDAGLRGLSGTLSLLRRAFTYLGAGPNEDYSGRGRHPFVISPIGVQATHGVISTDVGDYLDMVEAADDTQDTTQRLRLLRGALKAYGGPLLPGFHDEWVCTERDILSATHQRILQEIIAIHESQRRPELALEHALRAAALFPMNEKAHERAMALYVRCGRRAEALQQYRKLTQVLWLTSGARPSAAATRLAGRISRT